MNMWNLVVDLVVGRAEQHQRIRIAIRQGRSAVRRLFEQVACARVRRHTRRVERNTGELRLSSQRRRRGRSGWPCRRAPPAPGVIRRRDAGGMGGVSSLFLVLLFFINPRFIRKKIGITKQNPTIHFIQRKLVSASNRDGRPLPDDVQRGESSSNGGVSSEFRVPRSAWCYETKLCYTANCSKRLEESCGGIQGPKPKARNAVYSCKNQLRQLWNRDDIGLTGLGAVSLGQHHPRSKKLAEII